MLRTAYRRFVTADTRHRLYFRVMATPILGRSYSSIRGPLREGRLRGSTQLMIDGYPRSANSYARVAFDAANPNSSVASHLHSTAEIRRAARTGIPVLLLIRQPDDAAASLVQLLPGLELESAYAIYARFYESLATVRNIVLTVDFRDVIEDFNAVIRRINEFYGTHFNGLSSSVGEAELFGRIDKRAELFTHTNDLNAVIARPSSSRRSSSEVLAGARQGSQERARALAMYEHFRTS